MSCVAGIADAEDTVWRDSRRFTLHVLRDFGLGKQSVENYVNRELQDFLEVTQVSRGGYMIYVTSLKPTY